MTTLKPHGVIALRASPQSKMRISFRHPPPTSLIGALAYPLFNGNRTEIVLNEYGKVKSKADELRSMLINVALSSKKGLMYGPLFKINRLYHNTAESAVTSLPLNIIYGEADYLYRIAYIFDKEKLTNYTLKDLERAAWGITRLGSRESVVNVENVKTTRIEVSRVNVAKTFFSYSLDKVKNVRGKYDMELVVDWKNNEIGDYSRTDRIRLVYPLEENEVEGDLTIAVVNGEAIII
jgi:CRISPR-associated protein Cas5a/b/c